MRAKAELWEQYKSEGRQSARNELVAMYAHLVKIVAGRLNMGLPPTVDFDDLVGYGSLGLLDAVQKFDPTKGVSFEVYATARIRGAIIDGLRQMDWAPRTLRRQARELSKAYEKLEGKLGRSATDSEIAGYLGISVERLRQLLVEVSGTSLTSLDEVWEDYSDSGAVNRYDTTASRDTESPLDVVIREEAKEVLAQAIDQLPERERLVITLYYYEELTLKEIGEILGVSESRVSQLHTKAVYRLRGRLSRYRKR